MPAKKTFEELSLTETYIQGLPDHLNSPENKHWFASLRLEVIGRLKEKVLVTTWRHTSLDRVVKSTIELEVSETITWSGDKLVDPGRLEFLEEAAIENLELRRTIHDLGQKYIKLENSMMETDNEEEE